MIHILPKAQIKDIYKHQDFRGLIYADHKEVVDQVFGSLANSAANTQSRLRANEQVLPSQLFEIKRASLPMPSTVSSIEVGVKARRNRNANEALHTRIMIEKQIEKYKEKSQGYSQVTFSDALKYISRLKDGLNSYKKNNKI